MNLGAFSISLTVKDLQISKTFYEKLGFSVFAGTAEMNYYIMKNGQTNIGLFQGMFEKNIITFNPGWDQDANNIENFKDVRAIQQHLKKEDIELLSEVDESTKGPGSIMITDPDGNQILIDQHI
ncbi:VOC family protein [Flammeovirga sp. EKP202]|uniref:VOC family protein n=1 Tax=Flammeovirga sp. EKP202 TaxID=2770592 RepID=UPI00165F478A|nr:VOC family protein [Flammeovirga sp. EKP202]MBD0400544.1 VOC family protein [Flammeovirga sp. EKP202]